MKEREIKMLIRGRGALFLFCLFAIFSGVLRFGGEKISSKLWGFFGGKSEKSSAAGVHFVPVVRSSCTKEPQKGKCYVMKRDAVVVSKESRFTAMSLSRLNKGDRIIILNIISAPNHYKIKPETSIYKKYCYAACKRNTGQRCLRNLEARKKAPFFDPDKPFIGYTKRLYYYINAHKSCFVKLRVNELGKFKKTRYLAWYKDKYGHHGYLPINEDVYLSYKGTKSKDIDF